MILGVIFVILGVILVIVGVLFGDIVGDIMVYYLGILLVCTIGGLMLVYTAGGLMYIIFR